MTSLNYLNRMLPSEPMTPLFTLGGVVSTSSHGSGRRFPPVSQQVIAMEYVDEKGEVNNSNSELIQILLKQYGIIIMTP